ncbi:MAG: cytochrome c [Actinobacteria bacterium]|nr:cytochrome c [Actinomycetota bacterium]
MQPRTRLAALALAAALGTAACGGGSGAEPVDPGAMDLSPEAAAGESVYVLRCTACHGADLTGASGPALGPGSSAAGRSLDTLRAVIAGGATGMPAWEGELSAAEIDGLVTFLAEVQGR